MKYVRVVAPRACRFRWNSLPVLGVLDAVTGVPRLTLQALAAVAVLAWVQGASPARTVATTEPLGARIDRYVRSMVDAGEFQGAVLVARNGRVLFARGY